MQKHGRNDPCPCGSGRKFKRCCGLRDEVDARTTVRLTAKAQARALGVTPGPDGAGQWRRIARFLNYVARDQARSREELAELTGFDLALVNNALDCSGPFPIEALCALAVVLDVTLEPREERTVPEASSLLARAVGEHTSLEPWLARSLARGVTAQDFRMLAALFAGTEVFVEDEIRAEFVRALAFVGEALDRGQVSDAEDLLATMIRAAERDELTTMTMPTVPPELRNLSPA
ncbi:MAG TPA: SEC-C domain-containing protein [Nannocystaceae bacterium]|nr:SEC-C domain-containing protein [Nannocystaceae bacterium]